MPTPRPATTDPALYRLTGLYARRGLRAAATLVLIPPAGALVVHVVAGSTVPMVAFAALTLVVLVVIRLLVEAAPRSRLGLLGGAIGFIGVTSSLITIGLMPPDAIPYSAGFLGLIPACVVVLALWELRAHLVWLAITTGALLVIIAVLSGSEPMATARWIILAGWLLGSVVGAAIGWRGRKAGAFRFIVPIALASAESFAASGPGSFVSSSPSRSRSWLAKMMSAMPAVNPTVTGKGM